MNDKIICFGNEWKNHEYVMEGARIAGRLWIINWLVKEALDNINHIEILTENADPRKEGFHL
jgi:hypothetical protein